jgi:hypothetical protein
VAIIKAQRGKSRLRWTVYGPSKHGKSKTCLEIAVGLIDSLRDSGNLHGNGRICVIDTERESSTKYAGQFDPEQPIGSRLYDFDILPAYPPYSPERYIGWLREAEAEGYTVVIIDQISHEWDGPGGCLAIVNEAQASVTSRKDSFRAWADVTPRHQAFIDAFNNSGAHIICTMRARTKHEVVKESGSNKVGEIRKIGVRPQQRKGVEYEFDGSARMQKNGRDHVFICDGSRCDALSNETIVNPDFRVGHILASWLTQGVSDATHVERATLDAATVAEINSLKTRAGINGQEFLEGLTQYGVSRVQDLSAQQASRVIANLKKLARAAEKAAAPAPALQEIVKPASKTQVDPDADASAALRRDITNLADELGIPLEDHFDGDAIDSARLPVLKQWYRELTSLPTSENDRSTYFYLDASNEVHECRRDDVLKMIAESDEPRAIPLIRHGDGDAWKTAADYGFAAKWHHVEEADKSKTVAVLSQRQEAANAAEALGEALVAILHSQSPRTFADDADGKQAAYDYACELATAAGYDQEAWNAHLLTASPSLKKKGVKFENLTHKQTLKLIKDLEVKVAAQTPSA